METNFNTSFIPDQPKVATSAGGQVGERINVALVIALVIFFSTIATASGLYFYRLALEKQQDAKEAELAQKAAMIDIDGLRNLELTAKRLAIASSLIANHQAFSAVLNLLETETLQSIEYTSLNFAFNGGQPIVTVNAVAPNYMSVYVQEQTLKKDPNVVDVKLGGMSLAEKSGLVSFTLDIRLKKDAISYAKTVTASSAKKETVSPPTTISTGTPITNSP